jgi:hypothetical protein
MKKLTTWLAILTLMVLTTSCNVNGTVENSNQFKEGYQFQDRHYHSMEIHEDQIYALYERKDTSDSNLSNALFSFSPYEDARLIAEGESIDFRVSQNNEHIAIEMNGNGNIEIYDVDGELLHTLSNEEMNTEEYARVYLEQWNDVGNVLWCTLKDTYVTVAYISINIETMEVVKYNDRVFNSDEYVLNPNTGWIVYSDFPVMLDNISHEEYMRSDQLTTLFLYNLMTKEEIKIDSYETNRFKPEWINDHEILYLTGYELKFYKIATE